MDLILWRHAEAEEGGADLERALTGKGRKQAAHVAEWLLQRLPAKFTLLASPAKRAQQTAKALDAPIETSELLAPDRSAADILRAVDWPNGDRLVIVVGHQPTLGRVAAQLLGSNADLSVQKGALWWVEARDKSGKSGVRVRAVVAPEFV